MTDTKEPEKLDNIRKRPKWSYAGLDRADAAEDVEFLLEGIERPDVDRLLRAAVYSTSAALHRKEIHAYILALEAENARLRAALRSANDPTHGHPDETDDRALDAGVGGAR